MASLTTSIILIYHLTFYQQSSSAQSIACLNENKCDCGPGSGLCTLNCITPDCMEDALNCRDGDRCIINCNNNRRACQYTNMNCPIDADCTINCYGNNNNQICQNANINCPINGDCTINCQNGETTCNDMTVNCPKNGNCTLLCSSSANGNGCTSMNIHIGTSNFNCIGSQCPSHYLSTQPLIHSPTSENPPTSQQVTTSSNNLLPISQHRRHLLQTSTNITCDGGITNDCSADITCPETENCNVYCTNSDCNGATITCPLNGDCYIECSTASACRGAVINATQQNGNFELVCDDSNDVDDSICQGIEVFGSTITDNIGTSFLVTCGRDNRACQDAIINCARGMDCEVNCHSEDTLVGVGSAIRSCRSATINGPTGHNLRVECEDNNACQSATIQAADSSSLNVTCADSNACQAITLHCPPNANGNKNCLIAANDNGQINTLDGQGTEIFAINAWDDIDVIIKGSTTWSSVNSGTMHCGENYAFNCTIDEWTCSKSNDTCNDPPTQSPTTAIPTAATSNPTPFPSSDPTIDPTIDPTADPTTDPTKDPTADPTIDPTNDPTTKAPTSDPTIDPTVDPTTNPTFDPTEDPTIDPTTDPTIDPTFDPTEDPISGTLSPTSSTSAPTFDPTTSHPTTDPTYDPTIDPTNDPTIDPTTDPTFDPTSDPTTIPTTSEPTTAEPSNPPTEGPTTAEPTTANPTMSPTTAMPSSDPTISPTSDPTLDPTSDPTTEPTTANPTINPTTATPTIAPSPAGSTTLTPTGFQPCEDCVDENKQAKISIKVVYFFKRWIVYDISNMECFLFHIFSQWLYNAAPSFADDFLICDIEINVSGGTEEDDLCEYPPCFFDEYNDTVSSRRLLQNVDEGNATMTIKAQDDAYDALQDVYTSLQEEFEEDHLEILDLMLSISVDLEKSDGDDDASNSDDEMKLLGFDLLWWFIILSAVVICLLALCVILYFRHSKKKRRRERHESLFGSNEPIQNHELNELKGERKIAHTRNSHDVDSGNMDGKIRKYGTLNEDGVTNQHLNANDNGNGMPQGSPDYYDGGIDVGYKAGGHRQHQQDSRADMVIYNAVNKDENEVEMAQTSNRNKIHTDDRRGNDIEDEDEYEYYDDEEAEEEEMDHNDEQIAPPVHAPPAHASAHAPADSRVMTRNRIYTDGKKRENEDYPTDTSDEDGDDDPLDNDEMHKHHLLHATGDAEAMKGISNSSGGQGPFAYFGGKYNQQNQYNANSQRALKHQPQMDSMARHQRMQQYTQQPPPPPFGSPQSNQRHDGYGMNMKGNNDNDDDDDDDDDSDDDILGEEYTIQ